MIDPAGIPTISGDMEALAVHAAALRGAANAFATTGQRINATWQQLGGVYQAPEAGQLLAATAPVQAISASVGEDIGTLAGALASYADEVRQIQAQLTSLRSQASEFVASVAGDEHWRGDGGKVDHHNQLIRAVDAQLAAFFDAQRRCANTINALYGGPQYRAENGDGQLSQGEYGYTADQRGAAAGQDKAQDKTLPWGHTEEQDRGVLGDVEAFFGGIKDGAVEFFTGLGALIGRDPTIGTWSWDTAGTAWKGVGTLALAAVVYTAVPYGRELDQKFGIPGFQRGELGNTLLGAGKSMIAYDEWGKDPARAAGMTTFNIISAVVSTKGVGTGLRTVGTVARGSRLSTVSSAGTIMVRSGEAIGKLPTVSDLSTNAVRRIPGLRLPNLADTTRITIPHHTDVSFSRAHLTDAHITGAHVELPTSHPHPGSVGDALSRTPHSGPPGHTEIPSQRVDAATPAHVSAHAHAPAEGRTVEPSSGLHHDPAGHAALPADEHGQPDTLTDHSRHVPSDHGQHVPYSGSLDYRSSEQVRHDFQAYYQHFDHDRVAVTRIVANNPQYRGIPTEDLVAIRGYTSDFDSSLNGNKIYQDINSALRDGDHQKLDYYDAHIKAATSGLNQLPRFEGQVFRGISVYDPDVAKEITHNYEPGSIVTERPFTSSSANENLNFEGLVQFTIDSRTGHDIATLSHFGASEREVLFPPGTDFRVIARSYDMENGIWHIVMREE